ncbi:MAG: hypothetical protein ACI8XO_004540 [Verrucomicrobiales bacterium]|jgi:uncharacterized protein YdcH (DUF465 family)
MRRRKVESATGNLDSLLDTMTNVVGILIIVIIVSQINVADAVKRIRDGLDPVSAEQMAQIEAERDQVAQQIEAVQSSVDRKVDPAEIEQLRQEELALKKEIAEIAQAEAMVDGLADLFVDKQKQHEELLVLIKTEEEGIVGMEQEIKRMELEKTPAKKVRMPNPRDPYEDAKEVLFLCAGDRVILIDYPGLLARTVKEIQAKESLVGEMKGKTPYYRQAETKKHVVARKVSSGGVSVSLNTYPDRPWAQFVMTPDLKGGGQSIIEGLKVNSPLRLQINRVKSDRNYIRFLVHPDAFETYLLARRIAEDIFIPVGWDPTTAKDVRRSLPGIRFVHEPPPVDPNKDKNKPPPVKPKPKPKKPKVLD